MAEIRVEKLHKAFAEFTAVQDSSFTVRDGEFFCLLGPSGCGKTTTLRMIAGLELPTSGQIYLGNEDVSFKRASARDIAFVFQMFALDPHMNVRRNIAFPLVSQGLPRAEIARRVDEAARILRIDLHPRQALRDERKSNVLAHVHVWVQREHLEHEGDVTRRGALETHVFIAEENLPRGRQLQAGDHAQRGRLAAARRAEQAEEVAIVDGEGRVLHRGEFGEGLVQVLNANLGHVGQSGSFETSMNITVPNSVVMNE